MTVQPIDVGLLGDTRDAGGDVSADVSAPPDAPAFIDASGFCQGHGPIPLPGSDQCTGDLAHLFRFAACACGSLDASGRLTTDSFDSSGDGGAGSGQAASIAANGAVATNAHTTLGGSVYAGGAGVAQGSAAVTLRGDGTVAHDLLSGGDVLVGGIYQVGGDLDSTGNVTIQSGSLSVVGTVHLTAGHSASGVTAGGGVASDGTAVAPPCDCSRPIDIAGIVAAHQSDNDDGALGLATTALDHPPSPVQLPCGRYYVDGVQGGTVQLLVQGRVALFVAGDVSVDQGLEIDLAPDAELDLFVSGNVSLQGATTLGNVSAPARVRLYVGGPTVTLSATASVGANVYAPDAVVALASSFEMKGALFAQQLEFSGDFTIHYDTSVLQTPGCTPSGSPCQTCDDCAGATPACKAGTCVPCVTTADCCAPLTCSAGRCVLPAQ
ncbi:MAG TPA: hypothetical protein VIF15_06765 [Polyangiaceae bacterium]